MEKTNRKLGIFTAIVFLVLVVAVFGFVFWEPAPEYIQGEAEATEVRISGKVPGRIAVFRFDEGDWVRKGDTVAVLDSVIIYKFPFLKFHTLVVNTPHTTLPQ